MQPCYLADGRKLATKLGQDVIVFEYVLRGRLFDKAQGKRVAALRLTTQTPLAGGGTPRP